MCADSGQFQTHAQIPLTLRGSFARGGRFLRAPLQWFLLPLSGRAVAHGGHTGYRLLPAAKQKNPPLSGALLFMPGNYKFSSAPLLRGSFAAFWPSRKQPLPEGTLSIDYYQRQNQSTLPCRERCLSQSVNSIIYHRTSVQRK